MIKEERMTGRDAVLKTIEFKYPGRIPTVKGESADISMLYYLPASDFVAPEHGMDEWGCLWKSLNSDMGDQGQVIRHPLADWNTSSSYRFPDPNAPGRVEKFQTTVKHLVEEGKFICASIGKGPMHLLADLRGFEAFLLDMMEYPERIGFMLDGIFGFLLGLTERFSRLDVDAIWIWDDQAMQTGPLFSMNLWCRLFKPRYAELFRFAHARGLKVFMHTCGHIGEHLGHLVEAGVDVIDNKQPSLWMDCPEVKQLKGKITFSTCLDIQTTMNNISESEVENATHKLIRTLSLPSGGFLGTCYLNPDLKIRQEKTLLMLEAFKTFRWNS